MREDSPAAVASPGTLTLVATPIGNLEDITLRALRLLREAHVIAAEDTRRTRKLLTHYGIQGRLLSCHAHNEAKRIPALLAHLRQGRDVALVSDAGTPGISDPGARLAARALEAGIPVTAVPGPSAVTLSLSLSGFPADRFAFYGFLPRKKGERSALLAEAAGLSHTLVFFEAPPRVEKTLAGMLEAFGNRRAALCRELTKRFEEVERARLADLLETRSRGDAETRGEFSIVIEGRPAGAEGADPREERLRRALEEAGRLPGVPLKEAARRAAEAHGLSRREVYQALLGRRDDPGEGPGEG